MLSSALLSLPLLAASVYANDHLVYTGEAGPELEARQTNDGRFKFYQMPTPASGPCDMATLNGLLYGEQQFINQLFEINPSTGRVREYKIPTTTGFSNATIPLPGAISSLVGDRTALSCAIRDGADGNIYASNGVRNQLVQLNVRNKQIKIFQNPANPLGNLFPFNDLWTGKEGMWVTQTTGNLLQYFSYREQKFTGQWQIPTLLSLPLGVYVGSDGLVYGCEVVGNKIFTFNPKTKRFAEYPLPVPLMAPSVVRAEKNGWVYFTLLTGVGMGRINMKSHKIELYPTNQTPGFGSVNTGPASDGKIWMSFFASVNALAGFDDQTKKYEIVPFPNSFAQFGLPGLTGAVPPYLNIAVNYKPGRALWFSSPTFNAVGRYALDAPRKREEGVEMEFEA